MLAHKAQSALKEHREHKDSLAYRVLKDFKDDKEFKVLQEHKVLQEI
jgi:hypothetical protein